jgi:hypothetical protein
MGHHLILGTLTDMVTGRRLPDTHDERYRQKVARLLLTQKRFRRSDIDPHRKLVLAAGQKRASIHVDFVVQIHERVLMIVKYGPGSLVSRHRSALGISRLLEPYQIPVVVVTNGETADILDGSTGKPTAHGLPAIPTRDDLSARAAAAAFEVLSPERREKEARIVFALEIDDSCPCDETICRI